MRSFARRNTRVERIRKQEKCISDSGRPEKAKNSKRSMAINSAIQEPIVECRKTSKIKRVHVIIARIKDRYRSVHS